MKGKKAADYDFSILRELRNQYNVTLEKLAEATGVSFSTLTRIESNQNLPSLKTVKLLSEYFGMTPAHFLELTTAFIVERTEESVEILGNIQRRGLSFSEIRLRIGEGRAGQSDEAPHQHMNDYQLTWVLRGRLIVNIHGEDHELSAGEAVKFDAGFEHTVKLLDDSSYVVALVPKRTK